MKRDLEHIKHLVSEEGDYGYIVGGWKVLGPFHITTGEEEHNSFTLDFDNVTNRGIFEQGFDVVGDIKATGLTISDVATSPNEMDIDFNSSTNEGSINKMLNLPEGLNVSKAIEFDGVTVVSESYYGAGGITDGTNYTFNTQNSLDTNYMLVKIHLSSPTADSWREVIVYRNGSSMVVENGDSYGNEFPLFVRYDSSASVVNQKHCLEFVGFGSGNSLSYEFVTTKPFNNM